MDIGKAFSFTFEDEEWLKKLALAGLIFFVGSLLIVPGILFAAGYPIVVGRNLYNGSKRPLPDMDNMGEIFKDGFFAVLIGFIYALPIMLVSFPFAIMMGLVSERGDMGEAVAASFAILLSCFIFVLGIGLAIFLPGVMAQYVRTGDFAACFRVGEIWTNIVQPNLVNILLIFVGTIAAQLIVQLVILASVITICGPFLLLWPATLWASAFQGHLFGQLATLADGPTGLKGEVAAV